MNRCVAAALSNELSFEQSRVASPLSFNPIPHRLATHRRAFGRCLRTAFQGSFSWRKPLIIGLEDEKKHVIYVPIRKAYPGH